MTNDAAQMSHNAFLLTMDKGLNGTSWLDLFDYERTAAYIRDLRIQRAIAYDLEMDDEFESLSKSAIDDAIAHMGGDFCEEIINNKIHTAPYQDEVLTDITLQPLQSFLASHLDAQTIIDEVRRQWAAFVKITAVERYEIVRKTEQLVGPDMLRKLGLGAWQTDGEGTKLLVINMLRKVYEDGRVEEEELDTSEYEACPRSYAAVNKVMGGLAVAAWRKTAEPQDADDKGVLIIDTNDIIIELVNGKMMGFQTSEWGSIFSVG
jgi:hypothetical protein